MMLPRVAYSLAGRLETHKRWPLFPTEINGRPSAFLNTLMAADGKYLSQKVVWKDIIKWITKGGIPGGGSQNKGSTREVVAFK